MLQNKQAAIVLYKFFLLLIILRTETYLMTFQVVERWEKRYL